MPAKPISQSDVPRLEAELGAKFDAICECIRMQLGYAAKSELSRKDKRRIIEEAEEAIENWHMEASTFETNWSPPVTSELQKLLQEYEHISDSLIVLRDERLFGDRWDLDNPEC